MCTASDVGDGGESQSVESFIDKHDNILIINFNFIIEFKLRIGEVISSLKNLYMVFDVRESIKYFYR